MTDSFKMAWYGDKNRVRIEFPQDHSLADRLMHGVKLHDLRMVLPNIVSLTVTPDKGGNSVYIDEDRGRAEIKSVVHGADHVPPFGTTPVKSVELNDDDTITIMCRTDLKKRKFHQVRTRSYNVPVLPRPAAHDADVQKLLELVVRHANPELALAAAALLPVDPIVKQAREICARVTGGGDAVAYRAGQRDDQTMMQAVVMALRECLTER